MLKRILLIITIFLISYTIYAETIITIPKISKTPVIDGVLSDKEWDNATKFTGFKFFNGNTVTPYKTSFYAAYDDSNNLYIAFECINPKDYKLNSKVRGKDNGAYIDDSVEMYFTTNQGEIISIMVNSKGSFMDGKNENYTYDVPMVFKTKEYDDKWTCEFKIDRLNAGLMGDLIKGNFCRNLNREKGYDLSKFSHWISGSHYMDISNWGTIYFGKEDDRYVVEQTRDISNESQWLNIKVPNWNFIRNWNVDVKGFEKFSKDLDGIRSGGEIVPLPKVNANSETCDVSYSLTNVGADPPLISGSFVGIRKNDFEFSLQKYILSKKQLGIKFNGNKLIEAKAKRLNILFIPKDKSKNIEKNITIKKDNNQIEWFNISNFKKMEYNIICSVYNNKNEIITKSEFNYTFSPLPEWATRKDTEITIAPKPWLPVSISDNKINVWGRSFNYSNSIFGSEIISQEENILSSPIKLSLSSKNKTNDIAKITPKITKLNDGKAQLTGNKSFDNIKVTVNTDVEFDGFTKTTVSLDNPRKVKVDGLTLEIPIKKDLAKYMWRGPTEDFDYYKFDSWSKGRDIPKFDEGFPFVPILGIFDKKIGLEWYCESSLGWEYKDNKAIEIIQKDNETILKINFINVPVNNKEITYTFGLMPTPVKPMDNKWRDDKIAFRFQNVWTETNKEVLDASGKSINMFEYAAKNGVTMTNFHEIWTYPIFNGAKLDYANPNDFKEYIDSAKQKGINVMVYTSSATSENNPNIPLYSEDIYADTVFKTFSSVLPPQKIYSTNWGSKYKNYWIDTLLNSCKTSNINGIFMDGTTVPAMAYNPYLNLGFQDKNGKWHPQFLIFSQREFIKELYVRAKEMNPNFYFWLHSSTGIWLPTSSFVDSYFNGEHFSMMQNYTISDGEYFGEFYGKNIGIPCQIYYYITDQDRYLLNGDQAMARQLLYDNQIATFQMNSQWLEAKTSPANIWKIQDKFDIKNSKFVEPEDANKYIKTSDSSFYVRNSIWINNNKKLVSFASIKDTPLGDVTFTFNEPIKKVYDTINEKEINYTSNTLTLNFDKPYAWYLFEIE